MSAIGGILKEARAKKSISLEEVHSRIKIHPRVLQLLEENKFEKLPSPLFVKSFLKSYAEFLEISAEDILRTYEKEERKDPEQVLFIKPAAERQPKPVFNKNWILIPGFILAAAVCIFLVFAGIKAAAGWVSKQKFSIPVKTAPKPPPAKPSKSESAKAPASDDWLRSVEMGNFPKIAKKTALHLTIKAADAVWLKITCDGKVLFQNILKKGTSETWTASDQIEIWTGNSSSMVLTLNKYALGSPGKGVVKRMIINRDGVKVSS
jgi:cytoskeletal protein RodZ